MAERRTARVGQKVIHRHRIGSRVFKRVSEFVMVRGQPRAILHWIDIAGMRTPIYLELDPSKLKRIRVGGTARFHYDGITNDPTTDFQERPAQLGRRRPGSAAVPGGRRHNDPPSPDRDRT